MKRRFPVFVLAGALLAVGASLAFVAVRGPAPPQSMQDRVQAVAETLRCPTCFDLSVADSPSPAARQIRAAIGRRLAAGESPDEIRDFFVSRYGSSILLTPTGSGIDLIAWIVPALLVAAGLALVGLAVTRWSRRRPPALPQPSVSEGARAALARELREMEEAEWA